tara:strand:+ start:164 stop:1978 length:1815 start_codon:yes stop_codon:yes gene_type:complete
MAPNINQSAAAGIQSSMAGAAREMNYQPMNVAAGGYGATTGNAQGYGAAQSGATGFQGASVGSQGYDSSRTGSQGYDASRTGSQGFNAADTRSQGFNAARTGSQGFNAERLGGSPTVTSRDVTAGQLSNTDLSRYTNPYESQVVQSTLGDLDRARQLSMGQAGAQASAAGAFGGSRQALMEAETNRSFADQAARSAGQLRQAGFNQAQGMAQQDIQGRMQAGLANQQAGLQAGTTTANLAQQRNMANQAAGMRANEFGASAANQAALSNQQALNQASQFGASAANQAAAQASQQQQAANQFGASAANQAAMANMAAANQASQFGAGASNQASLANMAAANQASQFGASAANQAAAQAAQNQQAASMFGASAANQAALANTAATNQASQFGAGAANQQMIANQAALNQAGQFNSQQDMQAQLANQQAGLSGSSQRLGAAGQLGSLSNLGFGMGQTVNQNLSQQGIMQQAMQQQLIDAAKAQFAGYTGAPYQSIGLLSQALGASAIPQSSNTQKQLGAMDYLSLGAGVMGMSDARLKTNINQVGNLPNGLGLYTWDWTEDAVNKGLSNSMTLGVIAQEVEQAMPGMTVKTPSGYIAVNYGELYKGL